MAWRGFLPTRDDEHSWTVQSYSFDELVEQRIISKRIKYNYINALEKIGLSKNHLAVDSVEIEKSEEFKEYHELFN